MNIYNQIALRLVYSQKFEQKYINAARQVTTKSQLTYFIGQLSNELGSAVLPHILRIKKRYSLKLRMLDLNAEEIFSSADIYSFDGNTVRKHSAQSRAYKPAMAPEKFNLEFWTDGDLSPEEEVELREAISCLVSGTFKIDHIELAIRGSFFQVFRLLGFRKYIKDVTANLKTAFSTVATNQNAEAIERFSKIIEKHHNIIVRIDDIVAVKFTKNKQTHVLIEKMTPLISEAVNRNPSLLRNPQELYNLFRNIDNVIEFKPHAPKVINAEVANPEEKSSEKPSTDAKTSTQ